jgi:Ca2+-binding EF-hand superfamily protein
VNKSIVLVMCVLASSIVFAEETSPTDNEARKLQMRERADAHFSESDRNRDGKLSFAEWQEARNKTLAEQFRKLDGNNDGALTQDEMRQAREQRHQMRGGRRGEAGAMREKLRALDVDQDQALSRAEIGDSMPKLSENFDTIDSNRDGKLTREEMRAARESREGETR